ncbi:DUF551 domain-containing protein [Pantoea sp. B9002]|uniref:DUF551 domain-containing protein n=1 Tax=Pantoea sp. B9002 TaxID=2726979 RepID=UPI00159FC4B6|nr:DUF551 domain-containing protein [Pantoea sp. B9002]NWA63028.1 DUF551 domain-containing protein [Pantoea sp. B9002]
MMTEEQLIDRICLTCVDVRHAATDESAQKFINDIRGLAEQLAALTQPASPALKLPDDARRSLNLALQAMEFMGDTLNNLDAVCPEDVEFVTPAFNAVRSILADAAPSAPHTAPIEPICATGGAEWVKCSERMPDDDTLCLGIDADGVIWTMHYDCGELVTDTYRTAPPDITHWMLLPEPPALPL